MPLLSVTQRNDDGTPLLALGEQLLHTQPAVELHFDPAAPSEGSGHLFVTTKNVIWLSSSQVEKGYALDFPYIAMHALAGAGSSLYGGRACLYCQLDGDDLSEVAFIPHDPTALQGMYSAFSRGAMLNPDEEQEGEGDFYYNQEEIDSGAERLDGMMDLSELHHSLPQQQGNGQFEDPEEYEEYEGGMEDDGSSTHE